MSKKLLGIIALLVLGVNSVGATALSSAQSLAASGVITTASDYRLADTITRKEMMKIVMNLSEKNVPDTCNGTFGDVSNDWGCKYIETALVEGYIAANPSFRPDDTITKAESMKLVLKARGIEKIQDTTAWQEDYMLTAYENGIISTKYFDHNSQATRGWIFEIAATPTGSLSSASTNTLAQDTPEVASTEATGVYTDYSPSLVGNTNTTVLFLYADWCSSCKAAEANLLKEDFTTTDITLLKVDYDTELELRKKYGVTLQHTMVQVDANGDIITKWIESTSLSDIQSKVEVQVP